MTETWKPIDFIDGIDADRYEISDHGRVRSWVNSRGNRREAPKVTASRINTRRYPIVTMHQKKVVFTKCVHRLVAMAFIPNPEGKPEVAHNDGSRDNNHVSNLRWATRKENEADKLKHGRDNRGENHGMRKLTETCVRKIRTRHAAGGVSQETLAKEFGVTPSNIGNIIRRRTWAHLSNTEASQ